MSSSRHEHQRKLRVVHQRRLNILEELAATIGKQTAPPHVLMEIDELREKIAALDAQLADGEDSLPNVRALWNHVSGRCGRSSRQSAARC
ncbi:MAG: hypothetical protein RLZZ387_3857 [Chloroflexota bacterium]|jgi:tetrahydromethanopterin S-methyltransferase subunit B